MFNNKKHCFNRTCQCNNSIVCYCRVMLCIIAVFAVARCPSVHAQNVPTPLYFSSPLNGFPLELGTGAVGQETRIRGLQGRQRSLTISSAVWTQCTNVTDGQTLGNSKNRAYICCTVKIVKLVENCNSAINARLNHKANALFATLANY